MDKSWLCSRLSEMICIVIVLIIWRFWNLCNWSSHFNPASTSKILKAKNKQKNSNVAIFIWKGSHFTKSVTLTHSFATVKRYWSFDAQIALVPALLSSTGKSVCFNELFLSNQADMSFICHCMPLHFLFIQSFYCVFMASDLGASTCLMGWYSTHQNQ